MVLCVAALAPAAGAWAAPRRDRPPERYEFAQLHMGVKVRLVVYARDEPAATRACRAAFARFAELEQILSDYRPDSELMRLCARAGGEPVRVSRDLYTVLSHAMALARRSEGAFDPTVGPVVALWRTARKAGRLPPDDALRQARALVGWRHLRLEAAPRTARLALPGMRLDLGGIAKGFAADAALAALKQHGVSRALIEAGGDIVVGDAPPGQEGWRIEVPGIGPDGAARTLVVANQAVSTSGDTEQFVEIDGRRYSHVVDPRTGLGLTTRVAATVVARRGLLADGLSTTACVLGPEKGPALVASYPGAVVYLRVAGP